MAKTVKAGVPKGSKSTLAKKAAKKKTAKVVDPQIVEKRKQIRTSRKLFERLGFKRFKSDGVTINFQGRTGEIDDIFLYENVMVLVEYTVVKKTGPHVANKSFLYRNINDHQQDWVEYAAERYPDFGEVFDSGAYLASDYRVRICYISTEGVGDELSDALAFVHFVDGTIFRYFDSLARTIHKSAKFELFKYLQLNFREVGEEVKNTSTSWRNFEGHVLPESFSSFPKNFKIVSFYADPSTLLTMSYVLRRDSWRDEEATYQRVLQRGRMNQMRKYLTTEKRVFVNNIIVTLPNDTVLNELDGAGKNIDPKSLTSVIGATIAVPYRSNVIGIVDGQHRVFCYHEGDDTYEPKIKTLRGRQNLLVTGIIFPHTYSDLERRRFEAKLFLEINDKQKRTGSELKQSIELILRPYSTIAIAKSVVQRLNAAGALKGMLQTNYFDPPQQIRTSSIVSYGLRPLLKLDGSDSLYTSWKNANKTRLAELQNGAAKQVGDDDLLDAYVSYCVDSINALLVAAKKQLPLFWKLERKAKDRQLTPTVINGFIVCLRHLARDKKLAASTTYETKLKGLSTFKFAKYTSSGWKALGDDLYSTYFS